ncbi:GNAT family N-acetyltransferase [Shimia ponticola]|uniref:GNAT family N-acetyltransferase n=1 Tax=Shimia ponticola TaxID=2582893 RepID=UPI0011BF58A5|nr:GNAT family N-acetyltransferase [Shimia ponticola]
MIIVEPNTPTHPDAVRLLDASQALMQEIFADEENFALDHAALAAPDIRFFTARDGATLLGCGAMQIKDGYGEVKSFYVSPAARGKGVGAALIRQIEDQARDEGLSVLNLETGDELAAACRLYERHGFTRCGPFGEYEDNGSSVFMTKTL